jgi:hypothetical protein
MVQILGWTRIARIHADRTVQQVVARRSVAPRILRTRGYWIQSRSADNRGARCIGTTRGDRGDRVTLWTKCLLIYLVFGVLSIAAIGFAADSRHRELFAETLTTDGAGNSMDAVYFTASGLTNRTLEIFPADISPTSCDGIADYFAHGEGASLLTNGVFTEVECCEVKQKIDAPAIKPPRPTYTSDGEALS